MKQPISWHEDCLKNVKASYNRKLKQFAALEDEINKDNNELYFYEVQIKEAKKQGKDGFDSELYMKNKKHYIVGE